MRPERFCISPTHWSSKFKSWIRLLCKTVGMLVPWLPKESVIETKSTFFKTAGHGKLLHNWLLWSFHRNLMLNLLLSRTINFITKILISIPSRHTTSLQRCIVVVFMSRRRSTISQRCNNVAKKTAIKRRLYNVVILWLKRRCNCDVVTTSLYCC